MVVVNVRCFCLGWGKLFFSKVGCLWFAAVFLRLFTACLYSIFYSKSWTSCSFMNKKKYMYCKFFPSSWSHTEKPFLYITLLVYIINPMNNLVFFRIPSKQKTILKKSQHAHIARISHKASYNNPTITSSTTISQWHGNLEKEMKHSRYSCTFTIVLYYDDDDAVEWRLYV